MSTHKYFTKINNHFIRKVKLTTNQKMVYIILKTHANWKTNSCTIGMTTIAQEVNCSVRTVIRAIKFLVNNNIIVRFKNFNHDKKMWNCNTYLVNPCPCESVIMSVGTDTEAQILELYNYDSDVTEEKTQKTTKEENSISSNEIISKLKETYDNKIINKALVQFKKACKNKIINNIFNYIKAICENIKTQLELCNMAKEVPKQETYLKNSKEKNSQNISYNQNTYNNNNNTRNRNTKNRFHNLCESRTDNYTAEELERVILENQERRMNNNGNEITVLELNEYIRKKLGNKAYKKLSDHDRIMMHTEAYEAIKKSKLASND